MGKSRVVFWERKNPSANMVLVKDRRPILIDTGFGSDVEETDQWLREAGILPQSLQRIVNTHYHSDHTGGNGYFQQHYGVTIAAHKWEAHLINTRDPEACSSVWLDQPVEPYQVDIKLSDNDQIHTGDRTFSVLHTPGHTLGHISLYDPQEEVLIGGDLFHNNDVGWLNVFREGVAAIQRSMESLDRLAKLPIKQAYSGHGPSIDNPAASIDAARKRLERWVNQPEKASWHACKRIFSFALMIKNGLPEKDVDSYLLRCGWFQDFARYAFQRQPVEFIPSLLEEMIRSGAAHWHNHYLIASAPYRAPDKEWRN